MVFCACAKKVYSTYFQKLKEKKYFSVHWANLNFFLHFFCGNIQVLEILEIQKTSFE